MLDKLTTNLHFTNNWFHNTEKEVEEYFHKEIEVLFHSFNNS